MQVAIHVVAMMAALPILVWVFAHALTFLGLVASAIGLPLYGGGGVGGGFSPVYGPRFFRRGLIGAGVALALGLLVLPLVPA